MIPWKNIKLKKNPKIEVYYSNQLEWPNSDWFHEFGDWPICKIRIKALNIPAALKQLEFDQASPPDSLYKIPLV